MICIEVLATGAGYFVQPPTRSLKTAATASWLRWAARIPNSGARSTTVLPQLKAVAVASTGKTSPSPTDLLVGVSGESYRTERSMIASCSTVATMAPSTRITTSAMARSPDRTKRSTTVVEISACDPAGTAATWRTMLRV